MPMFGDWRCHQMQGGHRLIPPSSHPRTHPPYDVYRHPTMSHGYYHGQPQPHAHHGLATPIREPSHGYHSRPLSGSHQPPPMMYSHQSPAAMSSAYKNAAPVTTSTGKENSKVSSTDKKGKCNCKKSKCLKLYCECFAAQLYCQGCNCKDCYNLPDFEHEREKAVKAAIQKNRTAFEPRIAEEHNMGCKCRRSQCLKKYCEVRLLISHRKILHSSLPHHFVVLIMSNSAFKLEFYVVLGVNAWTA